MSSRFLPAGELFLDGRGLPGQPDQAAHGGRLPDHVTALHQCAPGVRPEQGRQDADRGCLARTVGPEDPSTVPRGTDRSMPRSARTSPNDLTSPSTKIAGPELICVTHPPEHAVGHNVRAHETYLLAAGPANE